MAAHDHDFRGEMNKVSTQPDNCINQYKKCVRGKERVQKDVLKAATLHCVLRMNPGPI